MTFLLPLATILVGSGEKGKGGRGIADQIEKWFQKAQAGDPEATELLCEYLQQTAIRYAASKKLPSVYSPEDLAQDVVQAFLQRLDQIREIRPWIHQIYHYVWAAAHRKYTKRRRQIVEDLENSPREGYDDRMEDRVFAHLDAEIFEQLLTPAQREVMLLRYEDDLSYEEIAKIMGKKPGAVRNLFRRAKMRVKRFLES